jgi:hypothetical protein
MDSKETNEETALSQWYKRYESEVGDPKDNETSEEFGQRTIAWWHTAYSPEFLARVKKEVEDFEKNSSEVERKIFQEIDSKISRKALIIVPEAQRAIADFYRQRTVYKITSSYVWLKDHPIMTYLIFTFDYLFKNKKPFKSSLAYILALKNVQVSFKR